MYLIDFRKFVTVIFASSLLGLCMIVKTIIYNHTKSNCKSLQNSQVKCSIRKGNIGENFQFRCHSTFGSVIISEISSLVLMVRIGQWSPNRSWAVGELLLYKENKEGISPVVEEPKVELIRYLLVWGKKEFFFSLVHIQT